MSSIPGHQGHVFLLLVHANEPTQRSKRASNKNSPHISRATHAECLQKLIRIYNNPNDMLHLPPARSDQRYFQFGYGYGKASSDAESIFHVWFV